MQNTFFLFLYIQRMYLSLFDMPDTKTRLEKEMEKTNSKPALKKQSVL